MNSKIANVIATYFGLGLAKHAPGTMGSLGTLPLAYVLLNCCGLKGLLVVAVILFFIGVKATAVVIQESHDDDPSKVVIDETVGQLLSFAVLAYVAPAVLTGFTPRSLLMYLLGFAFFRFFDILKMGPVKYADTKIKNAYGVMLDDVFAGIFAAILLFGVWYGLVYIGIGL